MRSADSGPVNTGLDLWSGASANPGVFVILVLHGILRVQLEIGTPDSKSLERNIIHQQSGDSIGEKSPVNDKNPVEEQLGL